MSLYNMVKNAGLTEIKVRLSVTTRVCRYTLVDLYVIELIRAEPHGMKAHEISTRLMTDLKYTDTYVTSALINGKHIATASNAGHRQHRHYKIVDNVYNELYTAIKQQIASMTPVVTANVTPTAVLPVAQTTNAAHDELLQKAQVQKTALYNDMLAKRVAADAAEAKYIALSELIDKILE